MNNIPPYSQGKHFRSIEDKQAVPTAKHPKAPTTSADSSSRNSILSVQVASSSIFLGLKDAPVSPLLPSTPPRTRSYSPSSRNNDEDEKGNLNPSRPFVSAFTTMAPRRPLPQPVFNTPPQKTAPNLGGFDSPVDDLPTSPSSKKAPPPAPRRINYSESILNQLLETTFISEYQKVSKSIALKEPFQVSFGEKTILITLEGPNLSNGQHSDVYRCTAAGGLNGKFVMKILKPIYDARGKLDAQRVIFMTAYQLSQYAQLMSLPALQSHVATHENFEPYREQAAYMGQNDLRKTVQQMECPILLTEDVANKFPQEFDANDNRWIQLQSFLANCKGSRIGVDAQINNIRVTKNGTVKLIDLFEHEPESPDVLAKTLADTYPEEAREFLFPILAERAGSLSIPVEPLSPGW